VNYKPATNTIYLYNDDGSAFIGGVTPGSAAQVSNDQCTLSAAGSSFTTSGNTLTFNVALTFSSTFAGQQNSYVYVQEPNGPVGTSIPKGTWTVPAKPPATLSLTPSSGAGLTQTFSLALTDANGLSSLNQMQLLFNTTPNRPSGCNVNYKPAENTIYLYSDDGSAFLAGVTPGSRTQVSNSQCTLNGAGSSISISGNTLVLNVSLTFSATFTGQENAYTYAQWNDGSNTGGWQQAGTWTP
jgi:hypothetical protein